MQTNLPRWSAVLALVVLVPACSALDSIWGKRLRPDFCADHPMDPECRQMYPDADDRCISNASCMAPTGVCDLQGSRMCVQCIAPDQTSACSGTTPACGGDHACHPCSKHDDCPLSNACLPDGSCAATTVVAYVDPVRGGGSMCTSTMPCKKVSDGLATTRPYVKLTGSIDETVVVNGGRVVTFLADPGATLTRTAGNGAVLTVQDDATSLSIYDLTIHNGQNSPSAIGCLIPPGSGSPSLSLTRVAVTNNVGIGVSASGGMLAISRSTITGNTAGGIVISGSQFDITNSFIVTNGGLMSGVGGIDISQVLAAGTHRLDFNTITNNGASTTVAVNTGVNCSTIGTPLVFNSNIIYGNSVTGGGEQIGGSAMCSATYSDVGPGAAASGTNINADPMFVDPARGNFHLMATSPAKDAADPNATLNVDVDGDARPQGARRDIGADEVR